MTPTLARQRGFFDGLYGRFFRPIYDRELHEAYRTGYALGAAALDPSEGR